MVVHFGRDVVHFQIITEDDGIQGLMGVPFASVVQFCDLRKVEENLFEQELHNPSGETVSSPFQGADFLWRII